MIFTRRFSSALSPEYSKFPGASTLLTSAFNLVEPTSKRPVYRVMDDNGKLCVPSYNSLLSPSDLKDMYRTMVTLTTMDQIFYDAQRQGRISFYMQNTGEEAAQVGSAAALAADDVVFAQYREAGVLMWRGFGLPNFAAQCFSNVDDLGKGRQMPIHYGSRALNVQTISSPLATQLPQATGAAYALKLEGKGRVCICYFGEGAASEGDFHAALNFAATLDCPVLFFCRNNGFAISTPSKEQYRGDGIVSRGEGYGMASIRVDGNDVLAVFEATQRARHLASTQSRPVLIEAMTYRSGHHSTSDDSTRYRPASDVQYWAAQDPIARLRKHLQSQGLWDDKQESRLRDQARVDVLEAFNHAEAQRKPAVSELFTDVYHEIPKHLLQQQHQLHEHLSQHGQNYSLQEFEQKSL